MNFALNMLARCAVLYCTNIWPLYGFVTTIVWSSDPDSKYWPLSFQEIVFTHPPCTLSFLCKLRFCTNCKLSVIKINKIHIATKSMSFVHGFIIFIYAMHNWLRPAAIFTAMHNNNNSKNNNHHHRQFNCGAQTKTGDNFRFHRGRSGGQCECHMVLLYVSIISPRFLFFSPMNARVHSVQGSAIIMWTFWKTNSCTLIMSNETVQYWLKSQKFLTILS